MTKALFARSFLLLLLLHFLLPRVTLSVSLLRERHARTHAKARKMTDDDDDDPFDFKLGVDALRAKTESKLATALENARVVDDADADDAPTIRKRRRTVVESSSRLFVGAKEKDERRKKPAQNRMPTTIETRRGRRRTTMPHRRPSSLSARKRKSSSRRWGKCWNA